MKKFDILPDGAGVHAVGSTRAGLFTAALQGAFVSPEPMAGEDSEEKIERKFALQADDSGALMVALLEEAIRAASANSETYEDVSFTLVTDKKAEGSFVGRRGKKPAIRGIEGNPTIEKNEEGEWETTIRFRKA